MKKKLRVAICGKNEAAIGTVKYFLSRNDVELTQVFLESESLKDEESPLPNFAEFAKNSNVPYFQIPKINAPHEFSSFLERENPDLIFSCQFSLIFKREIIEKFKNRIINMHFSPLPKYRGVAVISHAIMAAEDNYGVTLHLIDGGIDTGAIIAQSIFPIKNLTNLAVYNNCTEYGLRLVAENADKIISEYNKTGSLELISQTQNHTEATYFSRNRFDYSNNVITGDGSAADVYRFCLAYNFPPKLYPCIKNETGDLIKVSFDRVMYELGLCKEKFGTLEFNENNVLIATRDFWVRFLMLK